MRFMMMVKSGFAGPPSPELGAAMGQLIERELDAGRLIDTGGLAPPSKGLEVRLKGGRIKVVDGPYAEAREVIGGYAIFELPDLETARASAIEFMELHRQYHPDWEGVCEVRPFDT